MLLPVVVLQTGFGYRYLDPEISSYAWTFIVSFFSALMSGIVIAVIEETIFRGIFLQWLQQFSTTVIAIAISSLLYATVHFLRPSYSPTDDIQWYSSFLVLFSATQNLSSIIDQADAFIALCLAGIFLALVRIKSSSLLTCIAIHAGWVTVIKLFKSMTDRNNDAQYIWFYASEYDHITSHFTSIILLIAISYLLWQGKRVMHFSSEDNSAHDLRRTCSRLLRSRPRYGR